MENTLAVNKVVHVERVYAARMEVAVCLYGTSDLYIPFTPEERRQTLLHRWHRIAAIHAQRDALEEEARTLTYTAANVLANRIAHALLARELPKDVPVALLFGVEGDLLISLLAAWKAGHFFAWFEPRQPLARNQFMVDETGAAVVVTNQAHEALARQLWPDHAAVMVIEELAAELPSGNPPVTIAASDIAYVMYTSGSTGTPKGTVELHGNLAESVGAREPIVHFSANERSAFVLFGVGVIMSMAAAWMYGGCVLPFQMKEVGLARFSQWLVKRRITFIIGGADLRTWLMSLDGSQTYPALRFIGVSTGPSYVEHLQAYQRYLPDDCIFANLYSATEVRPTAIFLMDKTTRLPGREVPAGYVTAPGAMEIWDETGRPAAQGTVGEIVFVSPFISAGYWKSPELTATKFGVDSQGRRYYRMGDLGRLDEDGCLWVLGRIDSQVKIRGNRVETAEVEAALRELPGVEEAAVVDHGETDEVRLLLGFVASHAGVTGQALRLQLGARLPDYMVPATIVVLEELPRNANGKVARPMLRAMTAAFLPPAQPSSKAEAAKLTTTEARVTTLVSKVVAGKRIGLHDNFFDHGGHSLLAAQLMLEVQRAFGVDLTPRDFFACPTIAALAENIDQALDRQRRSAAPAPVAMPRGIEAVQVVVGTCGYLPLFLCLGWNGSLTGLMNYQELIRRMGNEWPLYGLVAGSDREEGLFSTLDELVNAAVAAVRQVQPHGPYQLVGECLGGKLAFEMARTLTAQEEAVRLLLLDAPLSSTQEAQASSGTRKPRLRWLRLWRERVEHHWQQMAERGWPERRRYLLERLAVLLPRKIHPQASFRPQYIAHKRYLAILTEHQPRASYPQQTTAIFTRQFSVYRAGWEALLPQVEVTVIEGQHRDYLRESGDAVAAMIRAQLVEPQHQAVPTRPSSAGSLTDWGI